MGKKDKAKKKPQPAASNDIFKKVEEIYGIPLYVNQNIKQYCVHIIICIYWI